MSALHDRDPHLYSTDWYEDSTSALRELAENLSPGSVAMAPGFHMYDALPAVQLGNPKLDTGTREEYKPLTKEYGDAVEAFALDTESNCVVFLDALMGAEMAWHHGYSMLQTVLSCPFVESELRVLTNAVMSDSPISGESVAISEYLKSLSQPESLVDVIRIAVLALIKAVGMSIELSDGPGSSVVFPEEDMHTNRYNLYFLESTPVHEVVDLVEKARKYVSKQPSLAERLQLRISWLNVLKQRVPRKPHHLDRLTKSIEALDSLDAAEPHDPTGTVESWFTNGAQSRVDASSIRHTLMRFDTKRTRQYWIDLLAAIRKFSAVYTVTRSVDLLGFYLTFSSRQEPAIVRAMAKALIGETEILGQSSKSWAARDMNECTPPPGVDLKAKHLDEFWTQAALCYADMLTAFCQSRCRMRDTLSTLILSFDGLQVAADQADQLVMAHGRTHMLRVPNSLDNVPAMELSSWVYLRKLQIMMWVVLLSFETDVLNYGEQGYTYWYAQNLCQRIMDQLGRMRLNFEQRGGNARELPGYSFLVSLELESQMLSHLCTAEYMLWIGLHKLRPPPVRANADQQYRLRFVMFESVGVPSMLPLQQYNEFAKDLTVEIALQGAGVAARTARNLLAPLGKLAEENREIPLLKRSALGLSIAVSTAIKLGSNPINVEIDRNEYHWYFPVPRISTE